MPLEVAQRKLDEGVMVGYRLDQAIVVVQLFRQVPQNLGSMEVVAGLNTQIDYCPNLNYGKGFNRLVAAEDGNTYTLVTFSPPNLRNLEYFTVDAILLQSTGQDHKREAEVLNLALKDTECPASEVLGDAVLEKINFCQNDRALLSRLNKKRWRISSPSASRWLPGWVSSVLHLLIACILLPLIWAINILNFELFGVSLAGSSLFFRQLDLRLRQFAYFPAQFLFYRNSDILADPKSDWPKILELPLYNEKLNINNSNYINLYNSIWLIVNDVLFGITFFRLFKSQKEVILKTLNQTLLHDVCLVYLKSLTQWVAAEHPYGFKLNDELGQFMGLMFIWSLNTWSVLYGRFLQIALSEPYSTYLENAFKCVCFMGVLFMVAAVMDHIKIVTLHIRFFNMVTTKVYHRQIEALKSLWQLFRGKKYNILRSRIDSLDEDQFRVDRLLLGTLLFTILVYLLPTTFAFYLLFYTAEALILTASKWSSKLIVVLNMYPLFVLLLKLKNSRRLQGGITFESRGGTGSTNWLHMSNKALTQDEIFVNFWFVFKNEGKVERIFLNLLQGRHIRVRDTVSMKFHYLMLPARYEMLRPLWHRQAGPRKAD